MYVCQVCTSPSAPNAKQQKIIIRRQRPKDDPLNNSIEREIPACPLCVEGYAKGIPMAALAKMHRPVSPPPQRIGLGSAAIQPAADSRRPPDGAAYNDPSPGDLITRGPLLGMSLLPPKNSGQPSKADQLIANMEEGGKRKPAKKPLKHLIKRGRNADHTKHQLGKTARGQVAKELKQAGAEVS